MGERWPVIDQATAAGATAVRLDMVRFMTDALRLYRSRGFSECPPYEETEIPSRLRQHWLYFERRLRPSLMNGTGSGSLFPQVGECRTLHWVAEGFESRRELLSFLRSRLVSLR